MHYRSFKHKSFIEALHPPLRQYLVICCPSFSRCFVCRLSVGKHTLLQVLVCAVALCDLQMCVLVRWLMLLSHWLKSQLACCLNSSMPGISSYLSLSFCLSPNSLFSAVSTSCPNVVIRILPISTLFSFLTVEIGCIFS